MWPRYRWSIHYAETLQHKIAAINGYIEELKTEILIRQWGSSAGANIEHEPSRKVFIVHGHDSELKHATARLVTNLGLEPVIPHEQANKGRTIIEKFTEYAQVGFAIVLLSADDEGDQEIRHPLIQGFGQDRTLSLRWGSSSAGSVASEFA
jgi:predicted nucleotide-binding protein